MIGSKARSKLRGRTLVLLVIAVADAMLFAVFSGGVLYLHGKSQVSTMERMQRAEDALNTLQRASRLVSRTDFSIRLYSATGDVEQLKNARSSAVQLDAAAYLMRTQLANDNSQSTNVSDLTGCATQLADFLGNAGVHSSTPDVQTQQCQKTIGRLVGTEELTIDELRRSASAASFLLMRSEVTAGAVAFVILMTVLTIVFRDMLAYQRDAEELTSSNERLLASMTEMEHVMHESAVVIAARNELQLCSNVVQVYQSLTRNLARLLKGTSGSLCMINNSRQLVEVVSFWGEVALEETFAPEACCGLRSGHSRWRRPGLSEIHCTHFPGFAPERYLCEPIAAQGNTLGFLYIQCPTEEIARIVDHHLDGINRIAQIAGMAIAALELQSKLEYRSNRDPLTGLFNRSFMYSSMEREMSRAGRQNASLAILMLDLDHFKRFNDASGHAAGDAALRRIAELLQSSIRAEDIACRYGGEEFTIILSEATEAVAFDRAENIRKAVSKLEVSLGPEVWTGFSISIGISLYPAHGEAPDMLLRRADQALYRAKRQGRNQVAIFDVDTFGGRAQDVSLVPQGPAVA